MTNPPFGCGGALTGPIFSFTFPEITNLIPTYMMKFDKRAALVSAAALTSSLACAAQPNVVFILADDMGYGDVSALNEKSRIRTPAIDALCREGVTFTDAHSGSSVSTPSRYGILTGRYAFRTTLKSGVTAAPSPLSSRSRAIRRPASASGIWGGTGRCATARWISPVRSTAVP